MNILKKYPHNKFDTYLFVLIVSTVFGVYGGALTAPRVVTIVLFPALLGRLNKTTTHSIEPLIVFFVLWVLYMTLSLVWSPSTSRGFEELLYYLVHIVYFLEIVVFAQNARNPIRTIAFSWLFAFLCTSIVAIWEITTDNHLSVANQGSERMFRHGGNDVFYQRYASVTFFNYNNYVVYICYCLPFFFFIMSSVRFFRKKFIGIIVLVLAFVLSAVIMLYNASRGGLLTWAIMFVIYSLFFFRNIKAGRGAFFLLLLAAIVIVFLHPELFSTIAYRLETKEMFDDSGRMSIWRTAFDAFGDTMGLGTGLGGISNAMKNAGANNILIPHNMFVELLLEHGIFVFIAFVILLIIMFKAGLKSTSLGRQTIILAFCSFASTFIISSGYLLLPQTWAYFACLYVFAYSNVEYYRIQE